MSCDYDSLWRSVTFFVNFISPPPQICRYSRGDLNWHLSKDLIFRRLKIQFSCVHARFPEQMLCSVSPQQSSLSTLFSIGWHTHVPTQIQIQTYTYKYKHGNTNKYTNSCMHNVLDTSVYRVSEHSTQLYVFFFEKTRTNILYVQTNAQI